MFYVCFLSFPSCPFARRMANIFINFKCIDSAKSERTISCGTRFISYLDGGGNLARELLLKFRNARKVVQRS